MNATYRNIWLTLAGLAILSPLGQGRALAIGKHQRYLVPVYGVPTPYAASPMTSTPGATYYSAPPAAYAPRRRCTPRRPPTRPLRRATLITPHPHPPRPPIRPRPSAIRRPRFTWRRRSRPRPRPRRQMTRRPRRILQQPPQLRSLPRRLAVIIIIRNTRRASRSPQHLRHGPPRSSPGPVPNSSASLSTSTPEAAVSKPRVGSETCDSKPKRNTWTP